MGAFSSREEAGSSVEYRSHADQLLDLIVHYKTTVKQHPPMPDVQPGFLKALIPADPPHQPQAWAQLMKDVQDIVMNGIFNTRSPHYHAHVPHGCSDAANLASMVANAVGNVTTLWSVSPVGVELEMAMMDWMAKAMHFPQHFMHGDTGGGGGGGVIVSSSSEGVLLSMCAARNKKIKEMLADDDSLTAHAALAKLVAYSSQEAHFNCDRACRFAMVQYHQVAVNKMDHLSMRGTTLQQAMEQDRKKGLIPFFVIATLGTMSTCAFDNLDEIGPVCSTSGCWLHVDAAYAGAAFLCPEFRHYLHGVEHVHSISVNFYKWMLMNAGCSGFWIKDASYLTTEFGAGYPVDTKSQQMPQFMSWQLHTCKPFNGLQLWFVMRLYGIAGLQHHVRNHVHLAKHAAALLEEDDRFSITHPVAMGLVCFKLTKQPDSVNQRYVEVIQKDRRLFVEGSRANDSFFIRFCMNKESLVPEDVETSVRILKELAADIV